MAAPPPARPRASAISCAAHFAALLLSLLAAPRATAQTIRVKAADICLPEAIAVDGFTNEVLVATGECNTIEAFEPDGSRFSLMDYGSWGGFATPYGLTVARDSDVLYASLTHVHRVASYFNDNRYVAGNGLPGFGGDGGPATSAYLHEPRGLAVDATSGSLFIADRANHRVRRVSLSSGTIATFAGTGSAYFSGDGGQATAAGIPFPAGLALDGSGGLLVCDPNNNRVRRVSLSSGIISTIAGTSTGGFGGDAGPATAAQLNYPSAVAVDIPSSFIFIADEGNRRVRRVRPSGVIDTVVGSGVPTDGTFPDGALATLAPLSRPVGLAVHTSGELLVLDKGWAAIFAVTDVLPSGTRTRTGSNSRTRSLSATVAPTHSPSATASPPLCRGLARVTPLSGVSGSIAPLSTASSGNPGMYAPGSCASGFRTFSAGSRLVYYLSLGSTAPLGGSLTVSTCGATANDTVVFVGTACPTSSSAFGCLAGNDNTEPVACGSNARASTVRLTASQRSFFIQVGGAGGAHVTSGLKWTYTAASASATRSRSVSSSRTATRSRTRKIK
jgi:hypothetical protein